MKTRHQTGYVYKKGGSWYVRYYDYLVQDDNSVRRIQKAQKLVPVCDRYRSKRRVMPLVEEVLRPLNSGTHIPESALPLARFVEQIYLPYVAEQRRPSILKGYRDIWSKHVRPRCGTMRLRDFRTCDGERLLAEIARQNDLARTTLKNIKAFMSGVFKHAKRLGAINGVNPMQDVSLPKGNERSEPYAYSLEEVMEMITVLPESASTVVATAAFTGMRKGELRGLLWENYNGAAIRVTQSVWGRHTTEPKTRQSKAPVPIIEPLARKLDDHRRALGSPESRPMFPSLKGTPLNLDNLAGRVLRPTLKKAGVSWHGWQAFRRGLATNLNRLGVADKTTHSILRHADISTTMNLYVKSIPTDAAAAMRSLEEICTQYAPNPVSPEKAKSVN